MTQYILRRLLLAVPVIIGVTFVAYAMLLMTGDPTSALAGEHATPELRQLIRERYGLDDPIYVQYWRFISQLVQGDLGIQIFRNRAADPKESILAISFFNIGNDTNFLLKIV